MNQIKVMIIAILNNKGGVGKTTTAVNLAASMAIRGQRVLLVDLDSQGSASLSLGIGRDRWRPSMADVLLEDVPIQRAIRRRVVDGLDLLPGSMELANADLVLGGENGRERRLATCMEPIRSLYSYVILDCPPSLSLLPINALIAADSYLVPVTPHYLALEGLVNLQGAVNRVHEGFGRGATLLGMVLTLVDYRTKVAGEIVDMIRGHYRDLVFKTEIRTNVRLTECPSFGKAIFEYDPKSAGALAYDQLSQEVLQRCLKGKAA